MGSSIYKYKEIMSDREIMNAKGVKKTNYKNKLREITIFEEEYPELSNEFMLIQEEQYEMFARKHMDYGLNNIALGGDIVNNSDDKNSHELG